MRGRRFKTQADVNRHIEEGYGSGELEHYRPWLRVQDVPSQGRSRKVAGIKIDRNFELLSDLEYRYLSVLEFSESVIDIREQYPLFPTDGALQIAAELGIVYPKYPSTTVNYVMTSDFVVTIRGEDGAPRLAVRTVKPEFDEANSAKLKRTVEKLELERAIWSSQGVTDWALVTPEVLGTALPKNLEFLRGGANKSRQVSVSLRESFRDHLAYFWSSDRTLSAVIRSAATTMQLPYMDGVHLFKHLCWFKFITLDIRNVELKLTAHCPMAHFTDKSPNRRVA